MDGFLLHDNFISNMEVHKCLEGSFEEGNTRVSRAMVPLEVSRFEPILIPEAGFFHESSKCCISVACFSTDPHPPQVSNSVIISKTASSDGLTLDYLSEAEKSFECGFGAGVPSRGSYSMINIEFHDFTKCPVFEGCVGCRIFNSKLGGS